MEPSVEPAADRRSFADYQAELYLGALDGGAPAAPLREDELVVAARERMSADAFAYVVGGAGAESTVAANRAALDRVRLVPRSLGIDLSDRDTSVELLGRRLSAPVLLAPIGVLGEFVDGGERIVACVVAELGLGWIVPTLSSVTLEDLAVELGPSGPRLFQLYAQRDPAVTASLVRRAEAAGYDAIVLTIDTQLPGWRPRDLAVGYHPLLRGEGIANHLADPAFRAQRPPEADDAYVQFEAAAMMGDPRLTWDGVAELSASTSIPVLVKGVQHPWDARQAIEAGCGGIVVSNHGGRQLDGAIGSLDALPAIVREVDGALPVLFDSGIRGGADIVKALALGADVAVIGRPYVWGLAAAGDAGVRHVLRALLAEFDLSMGLVGCRRPADISPAVLA